VYSPTVRSASSRAFVTNGAVTKGDAVSIADVWHGKTTVHDGDLIVWQRVGGGHIGIVKRVNGGALQTIEANTSNGEHGSQWNGGGVWARTRRIGIGNQGTFRITHFVRVNY